MFYFIAWNIHTTTESKTDNVPIYQRQLQSPVKINHPVQKNDTCILQSLTKPLDDDFKSFGPEWIGFTWLGYTLLFRQIVDEISQKHPEFKPTIMRLEFCFESEHSLVLPAGLSNRKIVPIGKVPSIYAKDEFYSVNAQDCKPYQSDIILQYSIPNIKNFELSGVYHPLLLQKMIYVPAIEYEYNPYYAKERDMTPITTFFSPTQPRRHKIVHQLWKHGVRVINYSGITTRERMMEMYDSSAILINIHQTPYHHTFEELRVLPALMRGMVIVCEKSPLSDSIPYSKFLVWSSVDEIPFKVSEVLLHYEEYFQRYFGPASDLPCILARMRSEAYSSIEKRILQLHSSKK
jgi:hypothetical protein